MRRVICVVLCLLMLAVCIPSREARAAERTKISAVVGTSNISNILVDGGKVQQPTFTITQGAPAYINTSDDASYWQKKKGSSWEYCADRTFSPGTWRYVAQVRIDGSNGSSYVLSSNSSVSLSIDGLSWNVNHPSLTYMGTDSYITAYSIEYTVQGTISSASVTITEPAAGEKPSYSTVISSGAPYYSDTYPSEIYENDVSWVNASLNEALPVDSAVFKAGYAYKVIIYLTAKDAYVFASDATATINGHAARTYLIGKQLQLEYTFPTLPKKTFTVTLNPNGGSVSPTTKTVTYGEAYGTMPTPTRSGYTFAGWWTAKDTGGKKVTASTVCYASGNYTLYARWTAGKTYTVTLNPNGGSVSPTTKTVTYGKAYGTMPTPTRKGYTFAGWWTAKDSGGKKVTASTVCYASGNYTLYARWTAKTFTVTLNPNGWSVSPTTKTVTYGKAYGTMPTPTRTGYTFAGWWTAKDSGGKKVTASTVCYASGNYTLYARWTAKTFTVTLNPNGGSVSPTTKTVTYGKAYGTMPTPTRTGYAFDGWYTAKTGGKKVTASTVCYASGNYTLYARWK